VTVTARPRTMKKQQSYISGIKRNGGCGGGGDGNGNSE
jgi:hypothetical protein